MNATGGVLTVDQETEPDLYWALRGGGNNFGVVTRFDLATYPQGSLFGGAVNYLATPNNSLSMFNAFAHFADNVVDNPKAALILASAYVAATATWLFANDYEYADPTLTPPPIFEEFLSIEPQISSTLRIATLSDLAAELKVVNPSGFRQTYSAATYKIDPLFLNDMYHDFQASIAGLQPTPVGLIPAIIFQPISLNELSFMSKNGGNPLGLSGGDGPLILLNVAIAWSDPADDARIFALRDEFMSRTDSAAQAKGLYNRYIYQNYANPTQNVFASYGEENLQRLRDISKKYDPTGVFQRLQPGYFKLGS